MIVCLVFAFNFLIPATNIVPAATVGAETAAASTITTKALAYGTPYATTMYIIKSGVPGPVFMVVGGVHGNEPSGYKAAAIVKTYSIKKGTLIVIPNANRIADQNFTRTCSVIGDLNRSFPISSTDKPDNVLASAIWQAVKDYKVTWLLDLHESYGYASTSDKLGQTIIYYPNTGSRTAALSAISAVNKTITTSYKKFVLFIYPTSGSLAAASGEYLGIHSFISETCALQDLSTRVSQQQTVVKGFLSYLGMR